MLVDLTAIETLTIVTGGGQAAVDALGDTPAGEPKRTCLLVPGIDVAWDECACGQFAQVIVGEYLTNSPFDGGGTSVADSCGLSYRVISVASSIVRCIPTMDGNGHPPSCARLLNAGVIDVVDRTAVRLAILCFLENLLDAGRIEFYQLGQQTPLGELGGCAGSVLTWSVAVANKCPC